jgi:hypothetical protein
MRLYFSICLLLVTFGLSYAGVLRQPTFFDLLGGVAAGLFISYITPQWKE